MDPRDIKSSCGTQNVTSNPMGIGLGIEYVTCRTVGKWTPPPHQIFMGDTTHPK